MPPAVDHGPPAGPVNRGGAGAMGVLLSALAGGSVAAAHPLVNQDGTHVEELALQAVSLQTAESPSDRAVPARPDRKRPPDGPSGSTVTALAAAPQVDAAGIVRTATTAARDAARAQQERARAERDAAARSPTPQGDAGVPGPSSCSQGTEGFGAVDDGVAAAGAQLRCMFSVDTVFGVAGRSNASDHPAGKALDLMVDPATGDRLAEYALANRERLGISYVIYRQRIDTGDGWESMEDRGGATANHMDHVHISFD